MMLGRQKFSRPLDNGSHINPLVFGSPVTGFRNHLRTVLRDKLVIRAISLTDFCWRKCNRRTFPIMAMVITPRPLLKNPAG